MEQKEIEWELMKLCERVAGARARYEEQSKIEDTIRHINSLVHGLGSAKPVRDAKELLADLVRERALSEDRLWRALIEGCAERISLGGSVPTSGYLEARGILEDIYTRIIRDGETTADVLDGAFMARIGDHLGERNKEGLDVPGSI